MPSETLKGATGTAVRPPDPPGAMVCPQPLLIHRDGTSTCPLPGCRHPSLTQAVLGHRMVVNCQAVLGDRCTVCHRPGHGPATVPGGGLCPGSAVVHGDLRVECSVASCPTGDDRGSWLARHGDVRRCRALPDGCPACGPREPD